jgi:hypothetical protein
MRALPSWAALFFCARGGCLLPLRYMGVLRYGWLSQLPRLVAVVTRGDV